ncbi:hypothetical protein AXG93_657s1040 [Marchantia polymorpha subsp. ruderalis]|uniref:Plant heme peroxidase family profile domain-containing protein n=1 Tax=Marchantia polymorpha subsp. ruderalis TaxID=1480154 RepID=A0A176VP30_MARPO|nr:hypothetical protein AXG93_657s1040 [Marchantia polymorpha subsp. ruderalis]
MAPTSLRSVVLLVLAVAVVVSDAQLQLSETFYDATCPQAASIVQQKVNAFVDANRGLAAALMRLHFHDCFVRTKPFGFMALDATNGTFDSAYYLDLLTNKGLLESDVALLSDPLGVEYAIRAVQDPMAFLNEFGWAMIKMGAIPALEPYGWRRHCAFVEPKY